MWVCVTSPRQQSVLSFMLTYSNPDVMGDNDSPTELAVVLAGNTGTDSCPDLIWRMDVDAWMPLDEEPTAHFSPTHKPMHACISTN